MLIYNTTYQVECSQARNFYIWLHEVMIPEVKNGGYNLKNPRVCRILSHHEDDGECYSLQWEVENSAELHRWHLSQGVKLHEELLKIFKDQVVVIPTLMEVLED